MKSETLIDGILSKIIDKRSNINTDRRLAAVHRPYFNNEIEITIVSFCLLCQFGIVNMIILVGTHVLGLYFNSDSNRFNWSENIYFRHRRMIEQLSNKFRFIESNPASRFSETSDLQSSGWEPGGTLIFSYIRRLGSFLKFNSSTQNTRLIVIYNYKRNSLSVHF